MANKLYGVHCKDFFYCNQFPIKYRNWQFFLGGGEICLLSASVESLLLIAFHLNNSGVILSNSPLMGYPVKLFIVHVKIKN